MCGLSSQLAVVGMNKMYTPAGYANSSTTASSKSSIFHEGFYQIYSYRNPLDGMMAKCTEVMGTNLLSRMWILR